jgi:hypothetical protein
MAQHIAIATKLTFSKAGIAPLIGAKSPPGFDRAPVSGLSDRDSQCCAAFHAERQLRISRFSGIPTLPGAEHP